MLEVTGTTGNFVKQNQDMATQQGFASVSKIWYDKTLSYDEFLDKLEEQRRSRVDIKATPSEVTVEVVDDQVKFNIKGQYFVPTEHAFKQACNWLDTPQTLFGHYTKPKEFNGKVKYNRDSRDLGIIRSAFGLGMQRLKQDKEFLFRTYTDGTLRAMLSNLYKTIDNRWLIDILREVAPDGRVSHHDKSDCDTVSFNVLYPDSIIQDNEDGEFGVLSYMGNSEIGDGRLESYPSVFRAICMNGCIWDRVDGSVISVVHRGKTVDLEALKAKIVTNIADQVPLRQEILDKFVALRKIELETTVENVVAQVAIDNILAPNHAKEILKQFNENESGYPNMFGIVNAVTRAGQLFDRNTWNKFDRIGGHYLAMSESGLNSFLGRAKNIDEKKMKKYLGFELATVV